MLYLSNMIPEKGYLDLLEALGKLLSEDIPVEAKYAGRWASESDQASFSRRVDELQLSGTVTHLGGISDREQVRSLYIWADVFVLPTYYPTEAQPLTIIESLAAGTPVVSTRHASIPEMVSVGEEAELVTPRQPDRLADAIRTITSADRWLRASEQARARFDSVFSPHAVRRKWMALLSQVTSERSW